MLTDDELKFVDILQATISRLAGNCFVIKGWSVALGSVIIGFTAKDAHAAFALIALAPVLAFWGLDAYYLALERLYRDRYTAAVAQTVKVLDLNVGSVPRKLWLMCLFRGAVVYIHAPIAVLALIVAGIGPGSVFSTPVPAATATPAAITSPAATASVKPPANPSAAPP
jgi:hypothetical protein